MRFPRGRSQLVARVGAVDHPPTGCGGRAGLGPECPAWMVSCLGRNRRAASRSDRNRGGEQHGMPDRGSIERIFSTCPGSQVEHAVACRVPAPGPAELSCLPLARSSSRPGVPTTISTPLFSASVCRPRRRPRRDRQYGCRGSPAAAMVPRDMPGTAPGRSPRQAWTLPSAPSPGARRSSSGCRRPRVLTVTNVGSLADDVVCPESRSGSRAPGSRRRRVMPAAARASTVPGLAPSSANVGGGAYRSIGGQLAMAALGSTSWDCGGPSAGAPHRCPTGAYGVIAGPHAAELRGHKACRGR